MQKLTRVLTKVGAFVSALMLPAMAFAVENPVKDGAGGGTSLETAINNILPIVVGVAGVILVIVLIIGGIMYITSGGNEEGANKAKKLILDAIIGMVIVAVAYLIARYVVDKLTGTTPKLQ